MVTSEARPFAKTGGLADVAAALPAALGRLGHRVTVVLPRYRGVDTGGGGVASARTFRSAPNHYPVTFIELAVDRRRHGSCSSTRPTSSIATACTATRKATTADNAFRFAVLSRGALEYARLRGLRPSVMHAHDWQAGLAPVYARTVLQWRSGPRRRRDGADHPQPGVSRTVRARTCCLDRPGPRSLTRRRAGVLGTGQLPQRRHRLQRQGDDGQPDLRAGDPDAGIRLRVRRHPRQPRRRISSASSTASTPTSGTRRPIPTCPRTSPPTRSSQGGASRRRCSSCVESADRRRRPGATG